MSRIFSVVLVVGLVSFLLCSLAAAPMTEDPAFAEVARHNPADLPFTTLLRGAFSGVHEARQVVIREQVGFDSLFAEMQAGAGKPLKEPVVDFSARMIVGVFVGTRPTGGYAVTIERVTLEASTDTIAVYAVESQPPPDAMLIQALTQPFHLVTIPASSATVRFVLSRRQQ